MIYIFNDFSIIIINYGKKIKKLLIIFIYPFPYALIFVWKIQNGTVGTYHTFHNTNNLIELSPFFVYDHFTATNKNFPA